MCDTILNYLCFRICYPKQVIKNPLFSKIAFVPAIVMSAIYHEYVLWAPLRFVLPVLLLQYTTFGRKHSHILVIIKYAAIVEFGLSNFKTKIFI